MRFFSRRTTSGPIGSGRRWPVLLAAAAAMAAGGCDLERERPAAPDLSVPETEVVILFPVREQAVPADSIVPARVQANGLLTAVEVVLRRAARRDTVLVHREELEEPQETVDLTVPIRIPGVPTGTWLEFIGGAENVLGERESSAVVSVVVIDCVEAPLVCRR